MNLATSGYSGNVVLCCVRGLFVSLRRQVNHRNVIIVCLNLLSFKHSFYLCNALSLQGRAHRDQQLLLLKEHLEKYYRSRNRKWIVLFPEGGFLRKRRETSQAFAKKNNLPFLEHVTLPRIGATQVILKTLVAPQENGTPAGRDAVIKGKDRFALVDKSICSKGFTTVLHRDWV